MSCNNMEDKEELLVRSGDLLNSLGILRSAKINNYCITNVKFTELIMKNYLFPNTLPPNISEKIEITWRNSIDFFEEMGINNDSTPNEIKIKEITSRL